MMPPDSACTASPLARLAGALLLAAALFVIAATLAFGSIGRQSVWGWAFLALGALSLLGWFVGRRHSERLARDQYARQRFLLGANAFSSVALFLLLLVGLNYIAARRHATFDLTSNRINSLAPQTAKVLDDLPGGVTLTYVFFDPRPRPFETSVLNALQNASDKVRVDYVNARLEPERFSALNLSSRGGEPVLLAQLRGGAAKTARQEVAVIDEQNVTTALRKLVDPQPRTLFFLTGHGEINPLNPMPDRSMNVARGALEAQNYTIKTLALRGTQKSVPTDAAAVVAVAPQVDLSPAEEQSLLAYAKGEARLVLLMNYPTRQPPPSLPRWNNVARALGLGFTTEFVLDLDRFDQSPQRVLGVLGVTSSHALLRGVSADVVLPGVLALRRAGVAGLKVTSLFESSARSIARPFPGTPHSAALRPPFILAAVAERETSGASAAASGGLRGVVVGNAEFATDRFIDQLGNRSFFLAAVNWTVGIDALVSIPPKMPATNTLSMPDAARRFAILYSLFALPLLVLLIGGVVWWKRR